LSWLFGLVLSLLVGCFGGGQFVWWGVVLIFNKLVVGLY
jgi:hypothetical protein